MANATDPKKQFTEDFITKPDFRREILGSSEADFQQKLRARGFSDDEIKAARAYIDLMRAGHGNGGPHLPDEDRVLGNLKDLHAISA